MRQLSETEWKVTVVLLKDALVLKVKSLLTFAHPNAIHMFSVSRWVTVSEIRLVKWKRNTCVEQNGWFVFSLPFFILHLCFLWANLYTYCAILMKWALRSLQPWAEHVVLFESKQWSAGYWLFCCKYCSSIFWTETWIPLQKFFLLWS